jgi:PAS domain S-box-containing protein
MQQRAKNQLEPFQEQGLDAALARPAEIPLPMALGLALQLARALAPLHAAGIVHGDLRPANLLLAHTGDQVQLKLAAPGRAAAEDAALRPVGRDWAYLAPEQTGRMQRRADHRTDFYSLGVLLYRLLTGELPFQADDPLEWVHCHLARMPVPPHERVASVPAALSALVLKLLAKAPEDRYQSAAGLCADVEECLAQWQAGGAIAPFPLGRHDVAARFEIPSRLYGRGRETAALLAAFDSVATTGTPRLVTVAGPSGVGKSALIETLQPPALARRAHFIAGKFDQYQRDIPYTTLAQAFDGLVRQLLSESDAGIAGWRQAITEALAPNAQLMVSLIPRLELVIGPQPPVPELRPQQAQGRFQLVFRRFVGVFATHAHPLVLVLDDLQWADAATLALLADLATDADMHHLMLVGAYRANDIGDEHPLRRSLGAIRRAGGAVQQIMLGALSVADLAQLAGEALHGPPDEAGPLAQLVWDKTGGNPFFARQFLVALADEKLLQFDAAGGCWRGDLSRIRARGFTDNVADLMVSKHHRLPPETQQALARFACLGNAADAATLAIALQRHASAVRALLQPAEQAGLVCHADDGYAFLHDRVQETAYSLLPEAARPAMHLAIGRQLAAHLSPEALSERVFEVASQLNRGTALVESPQERERIAELNLMAAQRAKGAAAYVAALGYLSAATALLPTDCWERRHALSFAIQLAHAECEFLTGDPAQAEVRLAGLAQRAADLVELAAVACLRGQIFMTLGRLDLCIQVTLDYLHHVGITWSNPPTDDDVRREYETLRQRMGERPIEGLLDLPPMTDRIAAATLNVLNEAFAPACFSDRNLSCLVALRAGLISLEHGNGEASGAAYAMLAAVLASHFGDHQAALRIGEVGVALVERDQVERFKARVSMAFGLSVNFWVQPARSSIDHFQRCIASANRVGDPTYAAYGHHRTTAALLATGAPLAEVQSAAERALDFARRARFGLLTVLNTALLRLALTLRGLTPVFGSFAGPGFDEPGFVRQLEADPQLAYAHCRYWLRALQARYLAGDAAGALAASAKAESLVWMLQSSFEVIEYRTFTALSHAALWDTAAPADRPAHRRAVAASLEPLQRWAANCAENFADRAALVSAELARIEGREAEALRLYEEAIDAARDNGFVHGLAIACECAARFCLARGLKLAGTAYLEQAHHAYAQWGADGKVRQLESQHPPLRIPTARPAAVPMPAGASGLDLLSVAKASQAISGQIVLDELVDTLMRIVLESAGAQTGCLLLPRGEDLVLAAEAAVELQSVRVKRLQRLTPSPEQLPLTLIQYVRRSREAVLLTEASAGHPFTADAYFARQAPQSVLCLPILRQANLVGLLYLENRLANQAFPPERVQVLELLASQAAISLDNARLYADVRDSQARIRRLVDSNIIGIGFWDASGGFTDANDALLAMVGYSRHDLQSGVLNWECITPPEHRDGHARMNAALRASKGAAPVEREFLHKDGSHIPVLIGATFFDDSPDHGVAFVLDLTERALAQERLREQDHALQTARMQLAHVSRLTMLGELVSSIVHEVSQPLGALITSASACARWLATAPPHVAEARSALDNIAADGQRAREVIARIRALIKRQPVRNECLDLNREIQEVLALTEHESRTHGITLRTEFDERLPRVIGDRIQLQQVLLNLILNATEAMSTVNGRVRQLTVVSRCDSASTVIVEVRDTGGGFDATRTEQVFEAFYTTKPDGIGIGLSISRSIVEAHGGRLWASRNEPHGAVFLLTLPVAEAAGAPGAIRA